MFFWKREKRDTKKIQAVSPWRILFGKGRRDEKMNSTSFQGFENQKTSESFWYKKEEEVQRDSRLVNDCLNKCKSVLKSKSKPCFYRLFMSGQEDHLEEL